MNNRVVSNQNFIKDLNLRNISSGIVAGIFIITGPSALILEASTNGSFTLTQTIMWVFSVYVFGGIFGIILPLYYRIPIVGGHTLTGVAFLATVSSQFTFKELIGSYILSGALLLLIGVLGIFTRIIQLIPKEILSAMLAGMITKYMMNFVLSFNQLIMIGGVTLFTYLLSIRFNSKIPPVLAAILTGFIVFFLTEDINSSSMWTGFITPQVQFPEFTLLGFLSISIPLAMLILSNDIAVAASALKQNKYPTPVSSILYNSGVFSIITSLFGGQSANIAGMATVICSSADAGPKEKRYMGAVITGILLLLFGLFSWKLIPLIHSLPKEFISIIVGFSLLGVYGTSIHQGFANPSMKVSASFTFLIALSNVTFFNISAPVWALLFGSIIAKYIENSKHGKVKG